MNTQPITTTALRAKAKELGYKLQFKTNSLNPNLLAVGFVVPGSKSSTIGSNVFTADFRAAHSAIFDLLNSVHDQIAVDKDQKLKF